MAIDPSNIDSDLTLELDGEIITADEFLRAVKAFFGLVIELSRDFSDKVSRDSWRIKVYPGSAGIGLSHRGKVLSDSAVHAIGIKALEGIGVLESKAELPSGYSEKAAEDLRILSMLTHGGQNTTAIRIWARQQSTRVTVNTTKNVAEILDWKYEDAGSIEGRLDKLSAHDRLDFVVYEPIDDRAITCYVNEENLTKALQHFRKRVEVYGVIKYRRDGMPISINVSEIISLPEGSELPSFKKLRGILKDH